MAYFNWGGEVWCNEQPHIEWCDRTIPHFLRSYPDALAAWQRFAQSHFDNERVREWPYHAIVGDPSAGLLVALYKSDPWLYAFSAGEWRALHDSETHAVPALDRDHQALFDEDTPLTFTVEGIPVTLHVGGRKQGPNRVAVAFKDKQARTWFGVAGYELGVDFDLNWDQRAWPSRWWQDRYQTSEG